MPILARAGEPQKKSLVADVLSQRYPGLPSTIQRGRGLGLSDQELEKGIFRKIAEAKRRGVSVEQINQQLGPPPTTEGDPFRLKLPSFKEAGRGIVEVLRGTLEKPVPFEVLGMESFRRARPGAAVTTDPQVAAELGESGILATLRGIRPLTQLGSEFARATVSPSIAAVKPRSILFGQTRFARAVKGLLRTKKVKVKLSDVDIRSALGAGPGTPSEDALSFVQGLSNPERASLVEAAKGATFIKTVPRFKEGLGRTESPLPTAPAGGVQAAVPAQVPPLKPSAFKVGQVVTSKSGKTTGTVTRVMKKLIEVETSPGQKVIKDKKGFIQTVDPAIESKAHIPSTLEVDDQLKAVKALQTKVALPGTEVTSVGATEIKVRTDQPLAKAETLRDRVEKNAALVAKLTKVKGGRPRKADPLPDILDESAVRLFTRLLVESEQILEVDALSIVQQMDIKSVKGFLKFIFSTYDNWIKPGSKSNGLTHNISCTICFKPEEYENMVETICRNSGRIASMSFILRPESSIAL